MNISQASTYREHSRLVQKVSSNLAVHIFVKKIKKSNNNTTKSTFKCPPTMTRYFRRAILKYFALNNFCAEYFCSAELSREIDEREEREREK